MAGPCSMPAIEQEKRRAVSGAGVGYPTTHEQRLPLGLALSFSGLKKRHMLGKES